MRSKWILFIFLIIFDCGSQDKFKRLYKLEPEYVHLYLLRSPNPTLGIYKFKIHLEEFEGHFKNSKIKNIRTFRLDNSEYCYFKLKEGYYNLKPDIENLSKIVYMEKEKEYFFHFEIINRGFFSLPEYFIRSITKEEAIKYLLDYNKLDKCSDSMD